MMLRSPACTSDTWNADAIARFKFIEATESFSDEQTVGLIFPLLKDNNIGYPSNVVCP